LIIITTNGDKIYSDKKYYKKLKKYSWVVTVTGYAAARINNKVIKMHIYLFGKTEGKVNDHIDNNKLNNRESNIRKISQKENCRNNKIQKNNTTGYTGVSKVPSGKYRARIWVNYKEKHIGTYETKEKAFEARKKAEKKYW